MRVEVHTSHNVDVVSLYGVGMRDQGRPVRFYVYGASRIRPESGESVLMEGVAAGTDDSDASEQC